MIKESIASSKVNVYINAKKPYYYPGDKFEANILLEVKDKVNCNKMIVIAKGTQIIKASQTNKFANEEKPQQYESSSSSGSDDDNERFRRQNNEEGPLVEIDEKKNILKVRKDITISDNKVVIPGKFTYPFEVELPEDIPGTFLFLEKKIYAEVAYSVKVKLESLNIKKIIPIVVRQKEEVFNYPPNNQFGRRVHGCCCIVGQTSIKLTALEPYTKAGDPIKLQVNIDNDTNTTSTPITVEVYRKIILKGAGNKKIRVTKIVGYYQGKRIINAREKFQKKMHVAIDNNDFLRQNISQTKAFKSFKHKEIIPYLFQSMKSNNITCEFEVYAESQYANITNDDLGVFLTVLVYPIEDGVVSKKIMNLAKEFVSGIINKKFFLKGENLIKKEEMKENLEKKVKKPKFKRKIYEESEMSEETIKFENKLASKKIKKKDINEDSDDEEEEIDIKNFKKNNELSSINMNNNINNKKDMDSNENDFRINNNINNNNNNRIINISNNNQLKDSKQFNNDEISFGESSKEKKYFTSDQASNIKKDFNKKFLNDDIDEQMSDEDD